MNRNINLNVPDLNIVKSLNKIKWPLKNYAGNFVYLDSTKIDHIAVKRHFLKIRDIEIINNILLNPIKIIDKDYRKNKIYFGKRKGDKGNDNMPYLQIVTINVKNKEYIVTIYPRNCLKEKIPH